MPRRPRMETRRFSRRRQLIKNRGLHWKAQLVDWGKPSINAKAGKILGHKVRAKRGGTVNFWEQQGVYALYDGWELVYVGQALGKGGIGKRLKHHRSDELAERWDRFSWFGLRQVTAGRKLLKLGKRRAGSTEEILNQLEALLIDVAEPKLNGQRGTWNKDSGVERYVQVEANPLPVPPGDDSPGLSDD